MKRRLSRTGSASKSALSFGSDVQPSIGRAFAIGKFGVGVRLGQQSKRGRTFVPIIADGRVVHKAYSTQIRFDEGKILDIRPVRLERARLKQPATRQHPWDAKTSKSGLTSR